MRLVNARISLPEWTSIHDLSSGGRTRSQARECGHAGRDRGGGRCRLAAGRASSSARRRARHRRGSRPTCATGSRTWARPSIAPCSHSPPKARKSRRPPVARPRPSPRSSLRSSRGARRRRGLALPALTVYGAEGSPLAWDGRPASLPAARITGPAASFLVSTPLGLRLARLEPVLQAAGGRRRVGAVVAEAALSTAGAAPGVSASPVRIAGRLAPVLFGPIEPHAGDPTAFDVAASDGRPLGTARVSAGDIDEARSRWWGRVAGLLWAAAAVWLVLLWGPLADWRDTARTRGAFVVLTLATATAGVAAWGAAMRALEVGGGRGRCVVSAARLGPARRESAALLVATAERWRAARSIAGPPPVADARSRRPRGSPPASAGRAPGRWRRVTRPSSTGSFRARRSTRRGSRSRRSIPSRLASAAGSLLMHAAALPVAADPGAGARALVVGAARARPTAPLAAVLAVVAAGAAAWWSSPATPVFWTALPMAAVGLAMGASWDRARRILRHGSQPARLLVLFAALALPSLSAYPSLAARAAQRTPGRDRTRPGAASRQPAGQPAALPARGAGRDRLELRAWPTSWPRPSPGRWARCPPTPRSMCGPRRRSRAAGSPRRWSSTIPRAAW